MLKQQDQAIGLFLSIAATTVAIGMAVFYEVTSLRWVKR